MKGQQWEVLGVSLIAVEHLCTPSLYVTLGFLFLGESRKPHRCLMTIAEGLKVGVPLALSTSIPEPHGTTMAICEGITGRSIYQHPEPFSFLQAIGQGRYRGEVTLG